MWCQRSRPEDLPPGRVLKPSLLSPQFTCQRLKLAGLLVARIYNLGLNFEMAQRGAGQLVRMKIFLVANDLRLSQWVRDWFESDWRSNTGFSRLKLLSLG